VIKMMHGFFGTCLGGHKAVTFPAVEPCSRLCGPACLPIYLPRRCGQLRPLVMLEQYGWHARQRDLFSRYAGIVVTSDYMRREYERYPIGTAALTTAPLFPAAGRSIGGRPLPAEPTVLFVGRMVDLKGGEALIRAAAAAVRQSSMPMHLVLAGDGPQRSSWMALASQLRLRATWKGWVNGDARAGLFRQASLLAVPSLFPEPFGLVGLEAAAHGVPAVAFDVGGIGEWLHHGVNGRLVRERGDVEALASTLCGLLGSPEELNRLGAGALRMAAALSIDAHLDRLESAFARARESRTALA
jgi:glycosyltransferase involved in cell wall biosynthesis